MPPTGRRRKNKEPEQRVDADAAEATTPSRKRRKVRTSLAKMRALCTNISQVNPPKNGKAPATDRNSRQGSTASDATIENMEDDALRDAEAIIQRLRTAHYPVAVAMEYNNLTIPPNEQAYAKIAGRNWTYYVKTTNVIFGRPNSKDKAKRESMAAGEQDGTPVAPSDPAQDMTIDINLGPDQQISRIHAEIVYEAEKEQWVIYCNGRNGLYLDEKRIERGYNCPLHSGAILSILGTQMIFILPNELPVIDPKIKRQLLEEGDAEDEPQQPGDNKPTGTNVRYGGQQPPNAYQTGSLSRSAGAGGSGTQAAHALAALSGSRDPPGTPRLPPPQPKSKNSPAYAVKGVMIESTEEIDYSHENAKDIKPPHSYAQMIGQAIMFREEQSATLSQIYDFIRDNYAFFRFGGGGWQNSIRHNLSLSKHFEKIPRRTDEPGKGMKWQIVEDFRDEYMKKNFHESRLPMKRRLDSSGPNSPAAIMQTQRLMGAIDAHPDYMKRHSGSPSPPRPSAYPLANESFTPDRGPRLHTQHLPAPNGVPAPISANSDLVTPTFERSNPLASQQTLQHVDSPPTTLHPDNTVAHGIMHTPLPARSAPPRPFPSTVKPPSFYAKELFSSPAPFWKYADVVGSTPLRPMPDLSPEKFARPIEKGEDEEIKTDFEDEEDDVEGLDEKVEKKSETDEKVVMNDVDEVSKEEEAQDVSIPPPSSPLGNKAAEEEDAALPDESPTRTVSRPVSRREPLPPSQVNGASSSNGLTNGLAGPKLAPPPPQPKFNLQAGSSFGSRGLGLGMYGHQRHGSMQDDEDDDDGIDLSK